MAGCKPADSAPSWVSWHEGTEAAGAWSVVIEHQRATVLAKDGSPLCQTPDDWLVQDGFVCDIDHDGNDELVLLCWRQGSYGSSRPFWVDKDDDTAWTQHVFIVRPEDTTLRPVWMSSDIGIQAQEMSEDQQRVLLVSRDGEQSLWEWQNWGLVLVE